MFREKLQRRLPLHFMRGWRFEVEGQQCSIDVRLLVLGIGGHATLFVGLAAGVGV